MLSIVIVTFNSASVIEDCLNSISAVLDLKHVEVIVVDNGSTDETTTIIQRHSWAKLLQSQSNLGFAGANNVGVGASSGEYIWLLNPDTVISSGAAETLLSTLSEDPRIGVVGGCLVDEHSRPTMSFGDLPTFSWALANFTLLRRFGMRTRVDLRGIPADDARAVFPVGYVSGADMMTTRSNWDALSGMDESYFLYFEDTDFCARMHEFGQAVVISPLARVMHLEGTSFVADPSRQYLRLMQGVLIYARKHFGFGAALVLRACLVIEYGFYVIAGSLVGSRRAGLRANRPYHEELLRVAFGSWGRG